MTPATPSSSIDEAKRGSAEVLILALVEDTDVHGYDIARRIENELIPLAMKYGLALLPCALALAWLASRQTLPRDAVPAVIGGQRQLVVTGHDRGFSVVQGHEVGDGQRGRRAGHEAVAHGRDSVRREEGDRKPAAYAAASPHSTAPATDKQGRND